METTKLSLLLLILAFTSLVTNTEAQSDDALNSGIDCSFVDDEDCSGSGWISHYSQGLLLIYNCLKIFACQVWRSAHHRARKRDRGVQNKFSMCVKWEIPGPSWIARNQISCSEKCLWQGLRLFSPSSSHSPGCWRWQSSSSWSLWWGAGREEETSRRSPLPLVSWPSNNSRKKFGWGARLRKTSLEKYLPKTRIILTPHMTTWSHPINTKDWIIDKFEPDLNLILKIYLEMVFMSIYRIFIICDRDY